MAQTSRNQVIDIARTLSVFVVVVFHSCLFKGTLKNGQIVVEPWAAPTWFYPVTWVFMIMPLFFVAGGYANATSVAKPNFNYFDYLAKRGRRLVSPLTNFVAIFALLFSGAAWFGAFDRAMQLSIQLSQLLWFLAIYLLIVFCAPLGVFLHRRWGTPGAITTIIGLAVVAFGIDLHSFYVDDWVPRYWNMLFVWPLCHQLGVAYRFGSFKNWREKYLLLGLAGGIATICLLVFVLHYPSTAVGFADYRIANVQPPTVAMAVLAFTQCCVMAIVDRRDWEHLIGPRLERIVSVSQALLMTTYLWHIPCILLGGGILALISLAFPAVAPVLLSQVVVATATLALVVLIIPWIARLDYVLIPKVEEHKPVLVVAAYVFLMAGTIMIWAHGDVVHPDAPLSTAGVALLFIGALLMRSDGKLTQMLRP